MCYDAIKQMLNYWIEPDPPLKPGPVYDEWRRDHDLDCIIAGGDKSVPEESILNADMIFSLWIPLRATLNNASNERWVWWREFDYGVNHPVADHKFERDMNSGGVKAGRQYAIDMSHDTTRAMRSFSIKRHAPFLEDFGNHIDEYLPCKNEATAALEKLFELGQTRANVMILLDRGWNSKRGEFYDYMPHFLNGLNYKDVNIVQWIEREKLGPFFENEQVAQACIRDLAGIGSLRYPSMKELGENITAYLSTCSDILERRGELLEESRAQLSQSVTITRQKSSPVLRI